MQKTLFRALRVVCCLLIFTATHGQQPRQLLQSANQSYQKGDYEQARQQYEALLQDGYRSAALYYNLGNTYYRLDELGRAALNYKRAQRLSPANKKVEHNLDVILARLPTINSRVEAVAIIRIWRGLRDGLGSRNWAVVGITLIWVLAYGLWRWRAAGKRVQRIRGFVVALVALLLSSLPFALSIDARQSRESRREAVLLEETELREGADLLSPAIESLYPGTPLQLQDQIGDWYKVILPNGYVGWVTSSSFERV